MDKTTAEKLTSMIGNIGGQFNAIAFELDNLPDDSPVKRDLERAIATLMADLWNLQRPIFRLHPDVDKDRHNVTPHKGM